MGISILTGIAFLIPARIAFRRSPARGTLADRQARWLLLAASALARRK